MTRVTLALSLSVLVGCQDYEFEFKPDQQQLVQSLEFAVQQPSQADLLFVVDNSVSMTEEQDALGRSVDELLATLAPQDTSYRIGLVSTDVEGQLEDCAGLPFSSNPSFTNRPGFTPDWIPAGVGNCNDLDVEIKYPHDGARGRLIAAYDPRKFDVDDGDNEYLTELTSEQKGHFQALSPTGAYAGPTGLNGDVGARTVIDREIIQAEACIACGCVGGNPTPEDIQNACSKGESCFDGCAGGLGTALVTAYFKSNLAGFGIRGSGYEAGLQAGLLAVGVDPREPTDAGAISPPDDLTVPGRPNTFRQRDDLGVVTEGAWTRDEALLGVMYLSDEQDCSLPSYLAEPELRNAYEEEAGNPTGSICYQDDVATQFLDTARMSDLLALKKTSQGRVALGFIGGAQQNGPTQRPERSATPADCITAGRSPVDANGNPDTNCACLEMGDNDDLRWCQFTTITDDDAILTTCNALAGSRYIDFVSRFSRRTFDSVCKSDYGDALKKFALTAVEACFDLDPKMRPASGPNTPPETNIVVKRAPKLEADAGQAPVLLPLVVAQSADIGWYYQPGEEGNDLFPPQICLNNLDRLLGDVYQISVLTVDYIDYSK